MQGLSLFPVIPGGRSHQLPAILFRVIVPFGAVLYWPSRKPTRKKYSALPAGYFFRLAQLPWAATPVNECPENNAGRIKWEKVIRRHLSGRLSKGSGAWFFQSE